MKSKKVYYYKLCPSQLSLPTSPSLPFSSPTAQDSRVKLQIIYIIIIYNMNLWCKIEIYRSERAWTNKVWIQNMSKWIVNIFSGCGNAGPAGGHRTGRRLRIAKGLIIVNIIIIIMRLAANTTGWISSPGQPAGNTITEYITDQAWGRRPPVKMSSTLSGPD